MEAANRYEILSRLAVGGMAEIFLARSTTVAGVARYVVLKRILAEFAKQPDFVQMFLDEARLASQLQHPNIAQVFDVGKLGESYFFTMEYVHGETLRTLLQTAFETQQELGYSFILTTLAGAAGGLHHAHDRVGVDGRPLDIIHRDISPANVMVGYEGSIKVVDFGVAKASSGSHETRAGTVKGKVSYMSPEQCRGNVVDRRTDLFALGICGWELITRGRLYRRATDFDSMDAIVNQEPPPPSAYRANVPPEIDRIVLRLLQKDPARRHQTGEELVDDLEAAATKLGLSMNPSAVKTQLRDMFGKKPEPWSVLDPTVAPVTLTAAPPRGRPSSSGIDDLARGTSDVDLYSAIEISAAPDIPLPIAATPSGRASEGIDAALFKTLPRKKDLVPPRNVDDLLKSVQTSPTPKQPAPDVDFEMAATLDFSMPPRKAPRPTAPSSPAPATESDEDADGFAEDATTLHDEPMPLSLGGGVGEVKMGASRKTQPMITVAPERQTPAPASVVPAAQPRTRSAPPNIYVSPSLGTGGSGAQAVVRASAAVASAAAARQSASSLPKRLPPAPTKIESRTPWLLVIIVIAIAITCGTITYILLRD